MKFTQVLLLAAALAAVTGCYTSTTTVNGQPVIPPAKPPKDTPETVIVTYHVLQGREAEFPALLAKAWEIYRKENLVESQPHVIVRDLEDVDKVRFVEIFTWVNHAAPEHASAIVQAVWNEEMRACEARDGHRGLEGGEVQLIAK